MRELRNTAVEQLLTVTKLGGEPRLKTSGGPSTGRDAHRYDGPSARIACQRNAVIMRADQTMWMTLIFGGTATVEKGNTLYDWHTIERQGADVRVFWPLSATGFVLDQSLTATGTWSQVSFPYATNVTDLSISALALNGNKFYRLRKP